MEFTCDVCGATGYFKVTGELEAYRTDVFMIRLATTVCKEREENPALQATDEFQCPNLDAALVRALEARNA